jgi:hypothetical protein
MYLEIFEIVEGEAQARGLWPLSAPTGSICLEKLDPDGHVVDAMPVGVASHQSGMTYERDVVLAPMSVYQVVVPLGTNPSYFVGVDADIDVWEALNSQTKDESLKPRMLFNKAASEFRVRAVLHEKSGVYVASPFVSVSTEASSGDKASEERLTALTEGPWAELLATESWPLGLIAHCDEVTETSATLPPYQEEVRRMAIASKALTDAHRAIIQSLENMENSSEMAAALEQAFDDAKVQCDSAIKNAAGISALQPRRYAELRLGFEGQVNLMVEDVTRVREMNTGSK